MADEQPSDLCDEDDGDGEYDACGALEDVFDGCGVAIGLSGVVGTCGAVFAVFAHVVLSVLVGCVSPSEMQLSSV